jgi:S1-C subfamily serine protease
MNKRSMSETPESPSKPLRERLQRFRTRARGPLLFTSGVIAALVALLLYNALTPRPQQLTQRDVSETVANVMASATPPPPFSVGVHQAIIPSLVLIQTQAEGELDAGESKSQGSGDDNKGHGLGSGVVVNDQGAILTSLHIVAGVDDIQVTFADGTEASAMVIAEQPENDIAVLQPSQLPGLLVPATLGNPGALRIGDEAFVVGNPLGLYGSMSSGVISGLKRSFEPPDRSQRLEDLIQFDAAVNPGSSGGPLLNRYGQVVGIVTALVNPSGQDSFSGIGFAVPINIAGGAAGMPPY